MVSPGPSAHLLTFICQVALKARGIDKLLEEAKEDNKENDVRLSAPQKSE